MMYKLIKETNPTWNAIKRLSDNASIPFDPANTDYANFKAQINADEAQLEDADGNTMTAAEAKAYIATLP
jgi:hypothetical protein